VFGLGQTAGVPNTNVCPTVGGVLFGWKKKLVVGEVVGATHPK
jgi:hypothetical protein